MGMARRAHTSSAMTKSSSHTVRVPTGRNSATPERIAQHASHVQTIRRSSSWSR